MPAQANQTMTMRENATQTARARASNEIPKLHSSQTLPLPPTSTLRPATIQNRQIKFSDNSKTVSKKLSAQTQNPNAAQTQKSTRPTKQNSTTRSAKNKMRRRLQAPSQTARVQAIFARAISSRANAHPRAKQMPNATRATPQPTRPRTTMRWIYTARCCVKAERGGTRCIARAYHKTRAACHLATTLRNPNADYFHPHSAANNLEIPP